MLASGITTKKHNTILILIVRIKDYRLIQELVLKARLGKSIIFIILHM
jgi:hypothetical protein